MTHPYRLVKRTYGNGDVKYMVQKNEEDIWSDYWFVGAKPIDAFEAYAEIVKTWNKNQYTDEVVSTC